MFAMGPAFFKSQAPSLSYPATVMADSPIAYWQMNEASGTAANDSSGNSYNGAYTGSPTLGAAGIVNTGGTSVAYNGSSQYIEFATGYTPILSLNRNFSIEVWLKLTDLLNTYNIFSNGLPSSGSGALCFRVTTAGSIEVLQDNTASLYTIAAGLTAGAIYQIVLSYDTGNGWYFHKNGSPFSSGTNAAVFGTSGHTSIGVDTNRPRSSTFSNYFKGTLAHMSIYGSKLSDARIAAHYAAGH